MGYELRMHVHDEPRGVDNNPLPLFTSEDGIVHGIEIAVLDLCKIGTGPLSDLIRNPRRTLTGSFYATDGDTLITTDRYGATLTRCRADLVLAAIEQELLEDNYRRFVIARDLLGAILATFPPSNIFCYFYGH